MFREVFKVLAYFDWITPLEIVTRRLFDGPAYSFKVPEAAGWSGARIVKMLRQYGGITTFGHMVIRDHIVFHVPMAQARFAQYIIQRAGIPIINPMSPTIGSTQNALARSRTNRDILKPLHTFVDSVWRDIGLP